MSQIWKKSRAWFQRLGGFFHKARRDAEIAAELESHLELYVEDNLRAGMTAEAARRDALIKLGGLEQTKDLYRDRRGIPFLEFFWHDPRFGARLLAKDCAFTLTAVLTVALGIGANTAIFSCSVISPDWRWFWPVWASIASFPTRFSYARTKSASVWPRVPVSRSLPTWWSSKARFGRQLESY